jgi:hypothetical protein
MGKIEELDDLFRRAIKKRDQTCRYCYFDGGYIYYYFSPAIYPNLRWEIDNAILLCEKCYDFARLNPDKFRKEMLPESEIERLEKMQFRLVYYEDKKAELENCLESPLPQIQPPILNAVL